MNVLVLRGVELQERSDAMIDAAIAEAARSNPAVDERRDWVRQNLLAIRDYAAQSGLGLKGVATQVPRMSFSALSEIFNGKYKGDVLARMAAPDSLPQDIRRVQTRTFTNFKAAR
jgi:hypothetical protein